MFDHAAGVEWCNARIDDGDLAPDGADGVHANVRSPCGAMLKQGQYAPVFAWAITATASTGSIKNQHPTQHTSGALPRSTRQPPEIPLKHAPPMRLQGQTGYPVHSRDNS